MTKTRTQVTAVLAAAAVVLAMILTAAPHAAVVTSASGEVVSIDILGLTKNATNLAEQQFPAY